MVTKINLNPNRGGNSHSINFNAPLINFDKGEVYLKVYGSDKGKVTLNGYDAFLNDDVEGLIANFPLSVLKETNLLNIDSAYEELDLYIMEYPENAEFTFTVNETEFSTSSPIPYPNPYSLDREIEDDTDVIFNAPWVTLGYKGNTSNEGMWITSDDNSVQRNAMYIHTGKYTYDTDETANSPESVQFIIHEGSRKKDSKYLRTTVPIDTPYEIYRASAQPRFNQFDRKALDTPQKDRKSLFVREGWDNWYTTLGQELVIRFSMRIPEDIPVGKVPSTSIAKGMDDPSSIMVFQNRSRFFWSNPQDGGKGNIPFDIYWQDENFWFKNSHDPSHKVYSDEIKGMAPLLAKATRGEWIDIVLYLAPGINNDGFCKVYVREEGEAVFRNVYDYTGNFYGEVSDRFINDPSAGNPPKYCLGTPSWGFYPSTRMTGGIKQKWIDSGLDKISIDFTEIDMIQDLVGKTNIESILTETEILYT